MHYYKSRNLTNNAVGYRLQNFSKTEATQK